MRLESDVSVCVSSQLFAGKALQKKVLEYYVCYFKFCLYVFSDSSVHSIEEYVMDAVMEHNKLAASVDT